MRNPTATVAWIALSSLLPEPVAAPQTIDLYVHVDVARVRAQGLIAASAGDAEAEEAVMKLVRWRLDVADVTAKVSAEDGTVSVALPAEAKSEQKAASTVLGGLYGCEFFLEARDEDVDGEGGLALEYGRFQAWRAANPDRPWLDYNADPERSERRLAWLPTRWQDDEGPPMPVLLPTEAAEAFTSNDFESVEPAKDALDYPAVSFTLRPERTEDFETFTEDATGRRMAIALAGTVRSAPTLNGKLSGSGIIEGHFDEDEMDEILAILRSHEGALTTDR